MSKLKDELTYRQILVFWIPLAATWLMMATEGPILAAIIARLPEPKFNLAAYGVAFSFAVLIEAPIIMIMSASTALVKDKDSYLKLRNFTFALNAAITTTMIVFLLPPVFDFIMKSLVGLPPEVARLTHRACLALLPWPGAIGYRRFFQGILIADGKTRRVAYGTAVRLTSILVTSFSLYLLTDLDGSLIGGLALGISVTAEALATRAMADSSVRKYRQLNHDPLLSEILSYRSITNFYYPLALTSILALGVHPMVTFFLGKSRMSLESLAVMPVLISLVFIFRSLGLSYQEVAIALLGEGGRNLERVRRFAGVLALSVSGGLALIAFTPASILWFQKISGLSPELAQFAILPTRILVLIPALSVILSMQRGVLVAFKNTKPITIATAIEVTGIFCVLALTLRGLDLVGVVGAALALICGRTLANLYLFAVCSGVRKRVQA
jgi:Na+-driven multidrug efflux pump